MKLAMPSLSFSRPSIKLDRRAKLLLLLGVAAYLVFLLSRLPAPLVYDMLESQLPPSVKVYGLEGSVWQGRVARLDWQGRSFHGVDWELHPTSLLMGRTAITLAFRNSDRSHASLSLSRSLGGDLSLSDVRATLPMAELVAMARIPAVKLGGELSLNLERLDVAGMVLEEAEGAAMWNGASSQFPQNMELGDVSARLTTTEEGVLVTLADGGGPLELGGSLLLAPDGQYKLEAKLAARQGQNSPLGRSLRMLGNPGSDGKVTLNNSGNLADFQFLLK